MAEIVQDSEQVLIEDGMKEAYLTFAMSVIVSRALPDVRDGLKPCQRRILVAMNELDLGPATKPRKCGKIVGDTHGNYHPHGDTAIYDTLVRMAQPFSFRYPLVNSQGNFGSMDGDPPAAMRYTAARLSRLGAEMLEDIERDTVRFVENYDNTRLEPRCLPGRFPNLLANGASGIAVGMATSIPPHNITELCDAIIRVIDEPDVSIPDLMSVMPGPDFPTGGIICGAQGIYDAYGSGRGTVVLRSRTHVEEKKGRKHIIVDEVPFRSNRDRIVEKIAEQVSHGVLTDIVDVRNESDKEGTRLAIDLKAGADENVVLNQLFRHTPLQTTFSLIMIVIVDGRPETLNIRQLMQHYVDHRVEVIQRRTAHLLGRAEDRAHILEGLRVALIDLDEVLKIIRTSEQTAQARDQLMQKFQLSERQADAILAMRLRSLVGLERLKIEQEYTELQAKIEDYRSILADRSLVLDIIREDLHEIKERHGDERRTTIAGRAEYLEEEDLIQEHEVLVVLSKDDYVKRTALDSFRAQGRGGRGVKGADLKEQDFIKYMFSASSHDYAMFFTNFGLVYWLKIFQIPGMDRTARGRALVNQLELREGESVTGLIPVREFEQDGYLLMATAQGTVKKTALRAFGKRGAGGIIAIQLREGDRLIGVRRTDGDREVFLATRRGVAIRFRESDVRPTGRTSTGVKGIALKKGDEVVDMAILEEDASLLTVCEHGYGKRTDFGEYRLQGRGGMGIINIRTTKRNGKVVAVRGVPHGSEIMVITEQGRVVRIPADQISSIGRNTQGVRVIKCDEGDSVSSVVAVMAEEED